MAGFVDSIPEMIEGAAVGAGSVATVRGLSPRIATDSQLLNPSLSARFTPTHSFGVNLLHINPWQGAAIGATLNAARPIVFSSARFLAAQYGIESRIAERDPAFRSIAEEVVSLIRVGHFR